MRVTVHDRHDKAKDLIAGLKSQGAQIVTSNPDLFLIDFDTAVPYYTKQVEKAFQAGAEIVLYSHGAPVITAYDGIWRPYEHVRLYLAQSEGQKVVMQSYGYPHPIAVIGWHYCKIKPFKATKVHNVLYAPWHPHSDGYLMKSPKDLNSSVYGRLRGLDYNLTVYLIGEPAYNGVKPDPDVTFIQSDGLVGSAVKMIDEADLIVSYPGTFASLAVARGKPVVMYGQDLCPFDGYSDETIRYVANWDKYRDAMRYPYDIGDMRPKATGHMIDHASRYEATEWRNAFIGNPFDAGETYRILEQLAKGGENE